MEKKKPRLVQFTRDGLALYLADVVGCAHIGRMCFPAWLWLGSSWQKWCIIQPSPGGSSQLLVPSMYSCFDLELESASVQWSSFLIIQSHKKELNDGFKVFVLPNEAYSHSSLR